MDDGSRVLGETKITASKGRINELFLVPPNPEPLPETLDAIRRAHIITIGPGSLFTSLIPNLLVRKIVPAILNSDAMKVYICNLMTQPNESLGRTAADHIRALNEHAQANIFGYALINGTPISPTLQTKYAAEGSAQVVADVDAIKKLGVIPVLGDYLDEAEVARHAADRVARDLLKLHTMHIRTHKAAKSVSSQANSSSA
jgi:uncharacterized cofD-like protein